MIHLILGAVGIIIGIAGLVFAYYTNKETKRIKDVTRSGAWNLYQSANTAGGVVQKSLGLYKQIHSNNIDPNLIEQLSKADQLSLTVYHDCIRFIQLVEPKFDLETIEYWVSTEKIKEQHVDNFKKIVVSGEPTQKSES